VNKEEAKTQSFVSVKNMSNDRGVFVDSPSATTDLLLSKRRSPRIDDDSSDDGDLFCSADKENEMPPSAASVVSVSNPYARKKAPPNAASSAASSGAVLVVPATSTTSNLLLVDKNNAGEITILIRQSTDMFKDQDYIDNLRKCVCHSEKYASDTQGYQNRFVDALSDHPALSFLAYKVVDPEATDLKVRWLYLICRGTITEAKKQVLNSALLLFGETLYLLLAGENSDPTTMSTAEKAKVSLLSSVSCFSSNHLIV
jgi:hypothetical protein